MLWLWHRPAATAVIRPLAWEPPCATSLALKRQKRQKKKKKKRKKKKILHLKKQPVPRCQLFTQNSYSNFIKWQLSVVPRQWSLLSPFCFFIRYAPFQGGLLHLQSFVVKGQFSASPFTALWLFLYKATVTGQFCQARWENRLFGNIQAQSETLS